MTRGILAFGGYIPLRRLSRAAIAQANGWFNSALKSRAKGERAMCNWDEDSVTMAVEAARDCLGGRDRGDIAALRFASTTFPFLDRLNSGIVAGALNLQSETSRARSRRDAARRHVGAGAGVAAADPVRSWWSPPRSGRQRRRATLEMDVGDGAAAAAGRQRRRRSPSSSARRRARSISSITYRADGFAFDYPWEERWIRDEGYQKIVPRRRSRRSRRTRTSRPPTSPHFCMPATLPRVAASLAKEAGMRDDGRAATICTPPAARPARRIR